MKTRVFLALVIIQIGIIITFFKLIRDKQNSILGVSVNPIHKETIQQIKTDGLKYFYEPIPNKVIETNESWLSSTVINTINEDSLNERFNYSVVKEEGIFRIITIGDSFTYGAYVNTPSNWTELLENELNLNHKCKTIKKYEVINLGVHGYDWAYEVERYRRRGAKYTPDLLLSLIVDYDRMTDYKIQNIGKTVITEREREEFEKMGNYHPELTIHDNEISIDYKIQFQKLQINKLFRLYSGRLLMVDFEKNPSFQDEIYSLIKQRSQLYIEKTKLTWNEREYFLPDFHPNVKGHKKLMGEILGFLIKNNLIPCK